MQLSIWILAAVGSLYDYKDRLGVETAISRSRRFGAKSPYKPFLHRISRTQSLRHAVVRVKAIKRLPRVFSPSEVQSLLDSCTHLRDRFLLCLLHESGMRIGQALGLRHADIRSYDGVIDIVPRANSKGALAKSRSPYVVHVSKQAMALYADYLVHEYGEVSHDYVFVNWWGGRLGAPMRYATAIDLFRQLSKRTGLRATQRSDAHDQSRRFPPHHPALPRAQGSGDDEPVRAHPRCHDAGQVVGILKRHADRCNGQGSSQRMG
jgi:integrase/recombinase XerD